VVRRGSEGGEAAETEAEGERGEEEADGQSSPEQGADGELRIEQSFGGAPAGVVPAAIITRVSMIL